MTDEQIPENNGTFEVAFGPGRENDARRTDAAPDVELTIQDFSRLLIGCMDLDPEWLPGAKVQGDIGEARKVFYRKPCYITQRF